MHSHQVKSGEDEMYSSPLGSGSKAGAWPELQARDLPSYEEMETKQNHVVHFYSVSFHWAKSMLIEKKKKEFNDQMQIVMGKVHQNLLKTT